MTTSPENPYMFGSDIYTNRVEPLSKLKMPFEGGLQVDNSIVSGAVEVVFRDHARRLKSLITEAKNEKWFCFGAVAWLTHLGILRSLSEIPCSILIQKEDFLRPDLQQKSDGKWKNNLHRAYVKVSPLPFMRLFLPGVAQHLSYLGDPYPGDAIRCVGERPSQDNSANPRMHNKFLVFASPTDRGILYEGGCDREGGGAFDSANQEWNAHVVWTGSFNFTENAERSWENALIVRDSVIAEAYLNEWSQLYTFSEPLDWQSEYIAPEWRIGT